MHDAPRYTSLRDYLAVVRQQRVLIIAIALLFTGVAVALSAREEPVYDARASLSFRSEAEDLGDIGFGAQITETPEQRSAVASERVRTLEVAERTKERVKSKLSAAEILSRTTVQPAARTNFVVVETTGSTAKEAADLANGFARSAREIITREARADYAARAETLVRTNRALSKTAPDASFSRGANVERIQRLRNLARLATPVVLAVPAVEADGPVSPRPVLNAILGFIAGLTLALLIAFGRDALDRRFRSVREIKDELRLPLLGHVHDDLLGRSIVGNPKKALGGQDLEPFRILRTNIDFLDIDRVTPTIVVTSALPEEGKSTVSGALAATYASAGKRVLLVECDLRRPTLAARFDLQESPGLTDYLVGNAKPEEIVQTVALASADESAEGALTSIVCITAGTPTPRTAELLGSKRFAEFVEAVGGVYDAVIMDSCPLLPVADTRALIPHAGRVVLCVRSNRTTRDQARAAAAALHHFPDRPTGLVVTGLRSGDEADYGYYSYAYTAAG